ncbi:MAG TPA: heavy metal sensor histidine kinase [Terriglobales bacterium]|nr:heavy metal sensor histidine kinase [Terriglobales bacterium]
MRMHSLRFRLSAWYAAMMAVCLALAGASLYLGLERYLEWSLRKELGDQARVIGENLLRQVTAQGEHWVIAEVDDYAPEINGRFIRVVRPDGSVMYQSGPPKDQSFDPATIPMASAGQAPGSLEGATLGGAQPVVLERYALKVNGGSYRVETGAPYAGIQRVLHGVLLIFITGMPLVVATAAIGGFFIVQRGLAPINAITQQAERISSRTFSERLPVPQTGDEIESLSISLNRMISRLEEAFEHINRFSADVSHELRTPLAILRGELEAVARRRRLPPDLLDTMGSTLEEVERLTRIVDHLLIISRLDAGEVFPRTVLNLGELANSTVEQVRLLAEEKSITIDEEIRPDVVVEGDPLRLQQLIVNLLDNAIKYTPQGGRVAVAVAAAAARAQLSVADTGLGIPADSVPHVFDRFYRADKARARNTGGAGLGLAIVKAICSAHGGSINVTSTEGAGSVFTVELPLATALKNSESATRTNIPGAIKGVSEKAF